ncbi:MAG: hypothetical protein IPK67_15650 [Planctomycetes bacterium]|nr:hypothetical protein [Planctomycetota bacterium]
MNTWNKAACAAGIVLASLTTGLVLSSCSTPVKNETEVSAFGFTLKTKTETNGTSTNEVTGTMAPGKCLKITYRGADGGVTGTDTITVPGSSQIPAGSTSQSFEIVDCPPPAQQVPPQEHAFSPQQGAPIAKVPKPLNPITEIFGGPITIDTVDGGPYLNAIYRFKVRNAGATAWDEILPILLGGPGTPVPSNVEVLSFTQTIPETLGARMVVADTSVLTEFRLDWNNSWGYADLASSTNVLQYSVPNGWNVVETFINGSDILPFGQQNVGETTRRTQGETASDTVIGKVLYYP